MKNDNALRAGLLLSVIVATMIALAISALSARGQDFDRMDPKVGENARVFLYSGRLDVLALGVRPLQQGIKRRCGAEASVHYHEHLHDTIEPITVASSTGKVVILAGHSKGADAALEAAERAGVLISLVITIDPPKSVRGKPDNVGYLINIRKDTVLPFWNGGGYPRGTDRNLTLDYGHIEIATNERVVRDLAKGICAFVDEQMKKR